MKVEAGCTGNRRGFISRSAGNHVRMRTGSTIRDLPGRKKSV